MNTAADTTARRDRHPTLSQVAERAGVSLKTASRAVNGESYVAAATQRKVLDAAAELGFRRNEIARNLRTGAQSSLVGLLIGDVANPFYARIARGAERRLREDGLQLITASTDEDPDLERRIIDELLDRRVRGLLLVTSGTGDSRAVLDEQRRRGTHTVFVDRPAVSVPADSVQIDNRGGIRQAVQHLLAQGHRRIALVGDLSRLSTHRQRVEAFVAELEAVGIRVPAEHLRTDCHDTVAARDAVADLLTTRPAPTALITTNNRISVGALHVLHTLPDPPALVGFDDFELADLLGVSVIAHDATHMGAVSADLLLQRMADDAGAAEPPRAAVIPTHLVARGSGERPPAQN